MTHRLRIRIRLRWLALTVAVAGCLLPALTIAASHGTTAKVPAKSPAAAATLRLAMPDVSPVVDPALVIDDENMQLANLMYMGLVRLDASYHVVPGAATGWNISKDRRTYTFHLRKGLKFSNGDPITARDFQFSITRSLDHSLNSPSAPTYLLDIAGAEDVLEGKSKTLSGIKVVDPLTLRITTRWPVTYFLMELTWPASFALDEKAITKLGSSTNSAWYTKPISSGPFRLKSYVANDRIILVPNKQFAGPKPGVAQVTILLGPLPPTDVYSYVSHNLDISPLPSYDASLLHQPGVRATNALAIDGLYMDFKTKPFDDRRVRQAFAMSLHRNKLAADAMGPTVTPFFGFVPPGQAGYYPAIKAPKYSPQGARDLLKAAGYSASKPFPAVTLYYVSDPAIARLAGKLTAAWHRNLGITVGTRALTSNTLFARATSGALGLYLYGWSADYPDPHDWLSLQWKSDALNNLVHYRSKKFDDLTAAADVTWQRTKRLQMYDQAQDVLVHDSAWLPLYIPHRLAYVRSGVSNIVLTGYGLIPRTGSWSKVTLTVPPPPSGKQ